LKLDKKEKLIWEVSSKITLPPVPDKEKVWERLIQEMEIHQNETILEKSQINEKTSRWVQWPNIGYIAMAYGMLLVFLSPLAFDFFLTEKTSTRAAQQETVFLEDGSQIMLNSESKIIYDNNYNIDNRSIKLMGEAYFMVAKNGLPFTIETDYGEITVLGTSFNVRAREDGFEVGVNEGKVEISNESYSIQLSKGQLIDVASTFEAKDISDISITEYPDWVNEKFYCNQTTLNQLCSEIERTFDIQIKFSDPTLKKITVTGVIEASNLNDVLHTVSLLTQHKFKLEGDICTII